MHKRAPRNAIHTDKPPKGLRTEKDRTSEHHRTKSKTQTMKERWRSIPMLPEVEASSAGRIRHVETGDLVDSWFDQEGYEYVTVRGRPYRVHRLVLRAFVGPPVWPRVEADHINFDRQDNRVSNLRWVSRQENVRHSYQAGRLHGYRDALGRWAVTLWAVT